MQNEQGTQKSAKDSFHFCKDESDDVVKKGKKKLSLFSSLFPPSHMFTQLIEETRKKRLELLISYYMEYMLVLQNVSCFPFQLQAQVLLRIPIKKYLWLHEDSLSLMKFHCWVSWWTRY